jgi:excisionase family DNA binding protein
MVLPVSPAVLTPAQVAERMQLPRRTVVCMCARGDFCGARKAGRTWRIPETAIAAFFEVQTLEPSSGVEVGVARPTGGGTHASPGGRRRGDPQAERAEILKQLSTPVAPPGATSGARPSPRPKRKGSRTP